MSNILNPWLESWLLDTLKDADTLPTYEFKSRPLQISEYLTYEPTIHARLSDTRHYIEVEFSPECIQHLSRFTEKRLTSLKGGIFSLGYFSIHLISQDSCEGVIFGEPKPIISSPLFRSLLCSPYLFALANELNEHYEHSVLYALRKQAINGNVQRLGTLFLPKAIQKPTKMASDCFRWKTMNSLDLSQCLISDEQSRLLNTENANTNIDVCVTKQIEENSPDNTQIKEEEGVEFYSWSSSPNLNTNIPLLTHLDQQDLERLAEVEPVSASVLSENELIRKIDQQKKPNDTTTSISQPEIDFSRIVSSVETQRERSGHIQDQQGTPIQRFVEIPDGHISDGESKSKPPDTIELFDAQEDSEDDLAEVEELEIFPSLYNQKTERSHETRNINPKFSKEAENSIITNTPLNFEKSLDMSQHELRYLRRPISDYNFDLGIQNELTTIYEDYVKENERLRRVKKRRSQPSAQTSLEKTDSENAFLTFYKDWIRIAKHRKEKGNIKIQSKKEG